MEIHGFNLIHSTTAKIQLDNKYEHVFNIIEQFIKETYDFDKVISAELLDFQKNYFIDYKALKTYPKNVDYNNDFLGYLQNTDSLQTPVTIRFDFTENKDMTLLMYCENLYFGRRRNFGKSWLKREYQQKKH